MMNRCKRLVLLTILTIGFTARGIAQSAEPDMRDDSGGLEAAFFFGTAHTLSSPLTISQPSLGNNLTFADLRFKSGSFESPVYYGFRIGYFLPPLPFLGVEAEFIHLKVYSDPKQEVHVSGLYHGAPIDQDMRLGEIVQQYSISHGANLLLFNVAGRYALKKGPASPKGLVILTARFGLGPSIPHTESTIDGQSKGQYETGRLAWQLAASAEVKLWQGFYALVEYKFTRTRQNGKIYSGTAESLLLTHHGIFGISYHL